MFLKSIVGQLVLQVLQFSIFTEDVPGIPRNLKSETISSVTIRVQWDPPSSNWPISKYLVNYYKDGEKTAHIQVGHMHCGTTYWSIKCSSVVNCSHQ